MPNLHQKWFQGDSELPTDISDKLSVADFHERTSRALTALGWEGQLISAVGLSLSSDGSLVQNARFIVRGALCESPIPVNASTIWEGARKDATVHISIPDCSEFQFTGGELCSDFLDHSAVRFTVTREGAPVLPTEWDRMKIGQFSLRLIAHLDKASNTKQGPHFRLSVILYPYSLEELSEMSNATQSVSWPGFRILEGKSELFPRAPTNFWGCPLLPLLNTQNRAANSVRIPPAKHLRFAIAELLRSAALPTVCRTRTGLKRQTDIMLEDPESFEPRTPTITWPQATKPTVTQGKVTII